MNGNALVVSSNVFDKIVFNGSKLFMREGTHLSLLDPITLYDAHIIMEPYTKLNMEDGSRIKMKKGIVFEVPKGAVLEIKNGSIEISN